jgi:Tfp pilus assembly protein PilE
MYNRNFNQEDTKMLKFFSDWTLIEWLIVVALLGVLLAIGKPMWDDHQKSKVYNNRATVSATVQLMRNYVVRTYPSANDAEVYVTCGDKADKNGVRDCTATYLHNGDSIMIKAQRGPNDW